MNKVNYSEKTALVIHSSDNVAVALTNLKEGERCFVRNNENGEFVTVKKDISFGHKIALRQIDKNESVIKYGEEIGKAMESIEKGNHIHNHNMHCERGLK